jgi:hypothetical protein
MRPELKRRISERVRTVSPSIEIARRVSLSKQTML